MTTEDASWESTWGGTSTTPVSHLSGPSNSTQDGMTTVTSTASGGTGVFTWTLFDSKMTSRDALLSATDVASVTWTPDKLLHGNWYAICTDGTDTIVHVVRVGASDGYILIDLASSSCVTTGTFGASTLFGATSTIGIGTVHGRWDSSMDGNSRLYPTGRMPLEGESLMTKLTSPDTATGDPGSSGAILRCMSSRTSAPTADEGYMGPGYLRTGAPGNKLADLQDLGSASNGNYGTFTGTLDARCSVIFDAAQPERGTGYAFGASSGTGDNDSVAGNTGTWSDANCWVGVSGEQLNSPGDEEVVIATVQFWAKIE